MKNQKWIRQSPLPYSKTHFLSVSEHEWGTRERWEGPMSCHHNWLTSLSVDVILPLSPMPRCLSDGGNYSRNRTSVTAYGIVQIIQPVEYLSMGVSTRITCFSGPLAHSTCQALHLWCHLSRRMWLREQVYPKKMAFSIHMNVPLC